MDNTDAARILEKLADGRDPATDSRLPQESVLQNADVVRALYCAVQQLKGPTASDGPALKGRDNAGTPWTEREINELLREFEAGMKLAEMAKKHGRTLNAIQGRLYRLGKVPAWRPGMTTT